MCSVLGEVAYLTLVIIVLFFSSRRYVGRFDAHAWGKRWGRVPLNIERTLPEGGRKCLFCIPETETTSFAVSGDYNIVFSS